MLLLLFGSYFRRHWTVALTIARTDVVTLTLEG